MSAMGYSRVCQFGKISARILDDKINTLQRGSNWKKLYDRYRPEGDRSEPGDWCNTGLSHLLHYSRKCDGDEEQGRMDLE